MFFSFAKLRAIAFTFILSAPCSYSRDESLFTSSVTYCQPPETLLIQQFDVAYIAKNNSLFFNISAASVEPNVNVSANLFINVYGMNPINHTINLCSILGGALCPLPMYNFTGTDYLPLPASLGVSNRIPGIAFKIPDLEAFAQLTLTEISTGNMKACVQATLSNGWSTHQSAVEWSTGALALIALCSALWHSLSPEALASFRFLELFYLYQTIVISSFLNINYPSVYRAFTLNFAWAMGLFSSSSLQNSINNMRHLTGGNMANGSAGSAVGLVNRKLSPYNVPGSSNYVVPQSLLSTTPTIDFANLAANNSILVVPLDNARLFPATGDVVTVTGASSNVLQAGVPIYVNSVNIATANAFMTVFINALILVAIALGVAGLIYVGLLAIKRTRWKNDDRCLECKTAYPFLIRAWALRLVIIMFTPIIVFVFYQWTLKDSWLSVLFSVIALIVVPGYIIYSAFTSLRLAFRSTSHALFSDTEHLASHGPLYAQYRAPRYYFFVFLLSASFLKAIFIAFAKGNGEVQVILMLVVELVVFLAFAFIRPQKDKGGNIFSIFLAVIRLATAGLMIAFVERLAVDAIHRVIIGIVMAVLFSTSVIVIAINLVIHSGVNKLWSRKSSPSSSLQESTDSMLEKAVGRPINPTPDRDVPFDPRLNEPYHSSASTPTSARHPSMYTDDSGSTTLGSILPSRWSISEPASIVSWQLRDSTPHHPV